MKQSDTLFAGSIPEIYDRFLVPMLFEPYARDLAERLAAVSPRDLLELAAGTGVLTRAFFPLLAAQTLIVATDLNQPMLDHAAARLFGDGRITWRQADAMALPLADQSFDAVACQFGVMFFPDRIRAYKEARRVLKPGGRLLFNVWDRIGENEFADVVMQAVATVFPIDPPRFLSRIPHGYHDTDRIREELTAAGFAKISIDRVENRSKAATPGDAAFAYCQGSPLRTEIEARKAGGLAEATKAAADALAHRFGHGPIEGRISAYVITTTR